MKFSSPLRYPGGKSAMTGLLRQIIRHNGLGASAIAEPFAGGAGASLSLLFLEESFEIYINDADQAIFDFWWAIIHRNQTFLNKLAKTRISMAEWNRQKIIYRSKEQTSRLRRGFSAFYLNRCNRSGIIMNGGPIGGLKQTGEWKLGARFNKKELGRRCAKVAEYGKRIHVSSQDGIKFIERLDPNSTFFFIDPPYYEKGNTLYLNALDAPYHQKLAERLRSMINSPWVLTYDDCPQIRRLYRGWATIRPFSLKYSASQTRYGKEVLITPKWMHLPKSQTSAAITW